MLNPRRNRACATWRQPSLLLVLWLFALGRPEAADPFILHLKNGDRITGEITTESTNSVTILHKTLGQLTFPTAEIAKREPATQPSLPTGVSGVAGEQTQPKSPGVPAGA